jgi:hypothetical protein
MKTFRLFLLFFIAAAVKLSAQVFPDHDPFEVVKSPEQLLSEKMARHYHIRTMTQEVKIFEVTNGDTVDRNTVYISTTFDKSGRITSDSGASGKAVFIYDVNGRLTGITTDGATTDSCIYDKDGKLRLVVARRLEPEKHFYTYDASGRVTMYAIYTHRENGEPTDSVCISRQRREYDQQGRPLSAKTTHPASGNQPDLVQYTYSDTGFTVYAHDPYGIMLAFYDRNGRIRSCVDSSRGETYRYIYNAAGQPVSFIQESDYDRTIAFRKDFFYTEEGLLTREVYLDVMPFQEVYYISTFSYTYY